MVRTAFAGVPAMRAILRLWQFVREIGWPYVALFGVLANVPMWIAGGLHRVDVAGWFNVDFLAVGILALFLPRTISALLLLLAIMMDSLAEISLTYFMAPADILSNAPEAASIMAGLIAKLCGGVLLVLGISSSALLLPKAKRRLATGILLAAFALACRGVNVIEEYWGVPSGFQLMLHGTKPDTIRLRVLRYERPARSAARLLMWEAHEYSDPAEGSENNGKAPNAMDGAAEVAYHWLSVNSRDPSSLPDFVLILVESWGSSSDETIRQSLVQPYTAGLDRKFTVLQGAVSFRGATISGESRELCGRTGGQRDMVAEDADFSSCLPDKLRGSGFHTIAIHGNRGGFYRRNYWYSRAGFQEIRFKWDLESAGLPDCVGTFTGVCDAAIANWIAKRLEQPDSYPRFVYWVTLNSHLPVPNPPPLPILAPCDTDSSLARDIALCNWYRLVLNVHQSIALLAEHSSPRPAVFVIVGDHAPPFSEPVLRDSFDQSAVPYVILLPNGAAGPSRAPF